MLESLKIAMVVAGVLSVGSGVIILLLLRYLRRQEERLKLIMKTLYLNTKGIKTVGEKTEIIFLEQQNGFDSQRKSFDHQRVLVSSLNRQLKHIESALFNGGNLDPTGGTQVDPQYAQVPAEVANENSNSLSPGSAKVQHNGGMKLKDSVRRQGVTLLKSLLEEKRMLSREASETVLPEKRSHSNEATEALQKAEKLTAIFEKNFKMNEQPRRTVNG